MSRKYLNTFIALAVLAVLWGAFYFYNRRAAKTPPPSKTKTHDKLLDIRKQDIESLTLTPRGGKPFTVSKENGAWAITAPEKLPASDTDVKAFLNSLTGATVQEVVDPHPSDLSDYGLKDPAETISIAVTGQTAPVTVLLGDETPTSDGVYAQAGGNPNVVLLADYMKDSLEKNLFDLRDKRVITLNLDNVDQISVRKKGEAYTLAKNARGVWDINLPPQVRAKHMTVETMLDELRGLSMLSLVSDRKTDLAKYGLTNPTMTIQVMAGGQSQTLSLGKETGGNYDAMNSSLDPVFTLGNDFIMTFSQTPEQLREKTLFSFSPIEVKLVEVVTPQGKRVFQKMGGKWKQTVPRPKAVPGAKMENLIDSLSDLRAESFPAKNPTDMAAYGLTKPSERFTVGFGVKDQIETVEVARVGKNLYARRATDRVPSELPSNALESITKALGKL